MENNLLCNQNEITHIKAIKQAICKRGIAFVGVGWGEEISLLLSLLLNHFPGNLGQRITWSETHWASCPLIAFSALAF